MRLILNDLMVAGNPMLQKLYKYCKLLITLYMEIIEVPPG